MIPPTPTPLPAGLTRFAIPQAVSIWGSAGTAIQWWHWLGAGQVIPQILIIIALVALGLMGVNRWVKELTGKDSQE